MDGGSVGGAGAQGALPEWAQAVISGACPHFRRLRVALPAGPLAPVPGSAAGGRLAPSGVGGQARLETREMLPARPVCVCVRERESGERWGWGR